MTHISVIRTPPRELLADRAYVELRDRVVTLRIAPGAPIDEDVIGQELQMGRTPVREAIKRLRSRTWSRPAKLLRCLVLDDPRSVALGNEPVSVAGEVRGRVTSGGTATPSSAR